MTSRRNSALVALALSFGLYLAPLVGPHAVWLLGEQVLREISGRSAQRSLAWAATDVAVALACQAVLAAFLYRAIVRPRVATLLPLLVLAPVGFLLLEWAYMLAIPTLFLIEADESPERRAWTAQCFLPDVALATVRTAPDLPLERAGRAWLTTSDGRAYAVLEDCARRLPVALAQGTTLSTVPFVLPSGAALLATWNVRTGMTSWWSVAAPAAEMRPLRRPPSDPNRVAPVLSADGRWTAWIEYVPGETETPLREQVVLREIDGDGERLVPLPDPGRASVVLAAADPERESVTLFEHEYATRRSSVVVRGFDGAPRGEPTRLDGADPQSSTFLLAGDGYVAWDAYREQGRYRVAWSLAGGRGAHEVPRGRGITAVDVDPDGRYVAISTTTSLNIGRIRDSVVVLRARDGSEAYRVSLPTYARSRVAFLGGSRFAHDDREQERFGVRIVTVPDGPG